MSAAMFNRQRIFLRQNLPLVLAVASHEATEARERLLMLLARSCRLQGGRVLVIEQGSDPLAEPSSGGRKVVEGLEGFPGEIVRGEDEICYARLSGLSPSEMFVALDAVTGTPPRYDLVLLHVRDGSCSSPNPATMRCT